jgi:glycosyltransferase involved in cell wall biosynthesis
MRIAFDSKAFCTQQFGGVSRYFVRLAAELISMGQEVQIFAPLHRNDHLLELPASFVFGRHLKNFPAKYGNFISAYNRMISDLGSRLWKADIVHETYYSRYRFGAKKWPAIATVHDMIHELFPASFPEGDQTSLLKRMTVARANHIICVSENTRKDLVRLFNVPIEKTSVVHHGIESFEPHINEDAPGLLPRPFILYVGGRVDYKNFIPFLQVVASSDRLRTDFDIVAFGGGRFSPAEHSRISALGLDPARVHQISGTDRTLSILYRQTKAFIYPSIYEGFGLPPLEAMAHGCPVASSNASSMPEVIGDACEYFDPLSPADMRRAIELVVYSPQRSQELIRKGYSRITKFSWSRCAQATTEIYKQFSV